MSWSGRATTARWSQPATAAWWCPPTCSSKAGIFGWTGRRRTTSAVKPWRRTPPTSRRWARGSPRSSSASARRRETPAAQVNALADGMWDEAGRVGAGIVGGDLVSSPQWVVSVTVLGDLGGRAPVLRSGARPARSWPSPANWATRLPDMRCGTTVLTIRRTAATPPGAAAALSAGPRGRRGGSAGDDRHLRRPGRRPASCGRGVRRVASI